MLIDVSTDKDKGDKIQYLIMLKKAHNEFRIEINFLNLISRIYYKPPTNKIHEKQSC